MFEHNRTKIKSNKRNVKFHIYRYEKPARPTKTDAYIKSCITVTMDLFILLIIKVDKHFLDSVLFQTVGSHQETLFKINIRLVYS